MDDAILISVIQHYEELYNLKHPHYSNLQRRQNIWEEVGKIMKQPANACRERWSRIRDNHRRALKLRQTKSGQAASKIKPPKFEKELTFLVPYLIDEENRVCNIQCQSPSPSDAEDNFDNDESRVTNEDEMSTITAEESTSVGDTTNVSAGSSRASTPPLPKTPQSRKRPAPSTDSISVASVLKDYIKKKEKPSSDPLTTFFLTMAETVRSFPLTEQIKIKRQVFNIVNDAESRIAMASSTMSTQQHDTMKPARNFYEQATSYIVNNEGFPLLEADSRSRTINYSSENLEAHDITLTNL